MTHDLPIVDCDLMIIGTGLTGMAAALFASGRGIDTVQVGMTGELNYASGLLDLMGVHPVENGRRWQNPWAAIAAMTGDLPEHPYARTETPDMRAAFAGLLDFLEKFGLPYYHEPERNLQVVTPVGTLKTTYAVPSTVRDGVRALSTRPQCLIAGFKGLKGFSALQIAESLRPGWPGLRACRVEFPGADPGDLYPERMALHLEMAENRARLAEIILPHLADAEVVGLPAVLGLYRTQAVFEDLRERLGRPVFEIPTMPPSISGMRLKQVFEQHLPARGVRPYYRHQVLSVGHSCRSGFRFAVGEREPEVIVRARGAILASGRFFGKGLHADRDRIRETVFGLPVHQPDSRALWHRKGFLERRGHAVNRAGVETDNRLRPLAANGKAAFSSLYAAGSILAHQDWVRQKCGSGLAIVTAYAAVKDFALTGFSYIGTRSNRTPSEGRNI